MNPRQLLAEIEAGLRHAEAAGAEFAKGALLRARTLAHEVIAEIGGIPVEEVAPTVSHAPGEPVEKDAVAEMKQAVSSASQALDNLKVAVASSEAASAAGTAETQKTVTEATDTDDRKDDQQASA
jgi:hypothetical protein